MDLKIAMGTITEGSCLDFTLVISLNVVDLVSSSNLQEANSGPKLSLED